MKRYILFAAICYCGLFLSNRVYAQLPGFGDVGINFEEVIKAGGDDMSTYMEYYTQPFINGFGTGIANGWYNTAATHKTLGFDLTAYFSLVTVPDEDLFFTFLDSEYNNLALLGGGTADLPTMLGGETNEELVSSFSQSGQTVTSGSFPAPNGFGEDLPTASVPVPMIQLGIGLPKGTELIVRYTPAISNDNLDMNFFGLGVKHDVKQWIPGVRLVPIDLSVLIGYTKLNMDVFLNESTLIQGSDDRTGTFGINALTFQALVSKKISVVTFYGGLGFNSVNSNFAMTGEYTLPTDVPGVDISVTDPVNLDYKLSGGRATAGIRLKFAVFTLHADYTLQKYNTLTVGLGLSVR